MKIIRNYLLKEIIPPFFLSLFVSTIVFTAGNVIQMVDLIMNKGVSIGHVTQMVALLMPSLLMITIPISTLSGVLLGFARLTSDNEIIALRASGVSIHRLSSPVLIVGLLLSIASVPLNYKIVPDTGYMSRKLLKEIGVQNPAALIEPGVFLKIFKNYIVFVYDMRGTQLRNVRIYQPQDNGPTRTLVAEKGEIVPHKSKNAIKIKLTNGIADESNPENPNSFYKLVFKNYYITLNLKDSLREQEIEKKTRELTFRELKEKVAEYEEKGVDTTPLMIEIHNKLSLAFTNLIFMIIAIPIGVKTHRREKSINFTMAALVFVIYWMLMLGGLACAIRFPQVPAWLGAWSPNIIFAIVSIVLFTRVIKR